MTTPSRFSVRNVLRLARGALHATVRADAAHPDDVTRMAVARARARLIEAVGELKAALVEAGERE